MRWILAASLFLAGCHHHGASEPAWPKSAGHVAPETWEDDGGESLEPRGDTSVEDSKQGEPVDDTEPDLQALVDTLKAGMEGLPTSDEVIIIDDDDPPPPPPDPVP